MSKVRTAELRAELTRIHIPSKARCGKGDQPKTQQQKEARYQRYSYIFHSCAFSSYFPLSPPSCCLPLQNIPSRQVRTTHLTASITTSGFLSRAQDKWIFISSHRFYFPLDGVQWQIQVGKQFSTVISQNIQYLKTFTHGLSSFSKEKAGRNRVNPSRK